MMTSSLDVAVLFPFRYTGLRGYLLEYIKYSTSYFLTMTKDSVCLFCNIAGGLVPAKIIMENNQVVAFYDQSPSAESHVLIVPKTHVSSFTEINDLALWDALRQTAQQLISELGLGKSYKLVFNGGSYQRVPHLHWHLLGGKMTTHP